MEPALLESVPKLQYLEAQCLLGGSQLFQAQFGQLSTLALHNELVHLCHRSQYGLRLLHFDGQWWVLLILGSGGELDTDSCPYYYHFCDRPASCPYFFLNLARAQPFLQNLTIELIFLRPLHLTWSCFPLLLLTQILKFLA